MADFKKILEMLALQAGYIHPQGHVQEGASQGVPMNVDYSTMTERWKDKPESLPTPQDNAEMQKHGLGFRSLRPERDMAINSAGFANQDRFAEGLTNPDDKEAALIANAILKGSYASGLTDKLSQSLGNGQFADHYGDLGAQNRISGTKLARPLTGFSALVDLYRSQHPEAMKNWNLTAGPMPNSTALGLTFTKRF